MGVLFSQLTVAQEETETACDLQALLEHQQEHAARLADLAQALETDRDHALEELYITGIAYQALAVQCGFLHTEDALAAHMVEHGDTEAAAHPEGEQSDAEHQDALARALAVGDPIRGEQLFNTVQPEVGFACATCHRVDTTERLIGPGLLGVGNPAHDPSAHTAESGEENTGGMNMGGMNMGGNDNTSDNTSMMMNMEMDPVMYLRMSIMNPGAFVVPGFPDNLMPRTYAQIFTETDINDLIAYLISLE
ncbi:MAG: c-type cytochrome [Anaerolineae bacterium]|nr:c-type cytochrome [Anaerolineae bacterium]